MIEHQKFVLQAVADDPRLFCKELKKSLLWLNKAELDELQQWLQDRYYETHKAFIEEVFDFDLAN